MGRQKFISDGRLVFAAFVRQERKKKFIKDRRAKKRSLILKERQIRRVDKKNNSIRHIQKQIDNVTDHPSKLGVSILKKIAQSRMARGNQRVLASIILLRFTDGKNL